jgi:hypothetical protein
MKYQIENTTLTRTTDNNYTHAVIIINPDGTPRCAVGYCSRLDLAHRLARRTAGNLAPGYIAEVRPVVPATK